MVFTVLHIFYVCLILSEMSLFTDLCLSSGHRTACGYYGSNYMNIIIKKKSLIATISFWTSFGENFHCWCRELLPENQSQITESKTMQTYLWKSHEYFFFLSPGLKGGCGLVLQSNMAKKETEASVRCHSHYFLYVLIVSSGHFHTG